MHPAAQSPLWGRVHSIVLPPPLAREEPPAAGRLLDLMMTIRPHLSKIPLKMEMQPHLQTPGLPGAETLDDDPLHLRMPLVCGSILITDEEMIEVGSSNRAVQRAAMRSEELKKGESFEEEPGEEHLPGEPAETPSLSTSLVSGEARGPSPRKPNTTA